MITIELRRSPGQPWGMRIGGGVDRGKVLVLEKVRSIFSFICICRIAFNIWSNKKYICMKKPFEHFHGALEMSILMDNDCMRIVALLLDVIYIDVVQNSGNISKTWVIWHSCSIQTEYVSKPPRSFLFAEVQRRRRISKKGLNKEDI